MTAANWDDLFAVREAIIEAAQDSELAGLFGEICHSHCGLPVVDRARSTLIAQCDIDLHATKSPAPAGLFLSGDVLQRSRQVGERLQIMRGQKVIEMGKGGLHATCQRFVAFVSQQRVQPNQLVRATSQSCNLLAHHLGVAPVPAIAEQNDHRLGSHQVPRVTIVERSKATTDIRAAAPVTRAAGYVLQRSAARRELRAGR